MQRSASDKRKARRLVNQRFLTAMMDMGIPNEKAELALSETGNVGVEVATEWLFSVPDHVLEKHLASEPNTPVEAAQQSPEDTRVLVPRRVPLQVCCESLAVLTTLLNPSCWHLMLRHHCILYGLTPGVALLGQLCQC